MHSLYTTPQKKVRYILQFNEYTRHGRIQTGGTCPLQTDGQQKWSDRFGFVSLVG